MDPARDEFKFLERKMVRERNRLVHAFMEAVALMEDTLERMAAG
jgi:hypothetical protein